MTFKKENVPSELRGYGQWVVWTEEPRGDNQKTGKIPKDPKTGRSASTNEPETWATFDEAMSRFESDQRQYQGVGFMLTREDPFCGIDLDDVINPDTGEIEQWALDIVEKLNSYTEVSPSGKGLRIFVKGKLPPGGNRRDRFEAYHSQRYLTVTGNHLPETPMTIEERQEEIQAVHAEIFKNVDMVEDALIQRIKASTQGEKFSKLMAGKWEEDYESQSEADLALCSIVSHWTKGDVDRIDKIFRQSGLLRGKWDKRRGDTTYGKRTIATAVRENTPRLAGPQQIKDVSPHQFFNKGGFVSKLLAEEIMRRHHIKFAGEMLWVYDGGVYRPAGKRIIKKEAQRLLDEESTGKYIKETIGYIEIATSADLPTPSTKNINVRNGRLNWRQEKLEPHNPKHFDIVQLPVEYDPEAKCEDFDRYLETTFDADVIPLIEELMGYALIPDTRFERAFLLIGSGANGKSVLLDVIRGLLGDANVSSIPLQALSEDRFKLAILHGKLVNTFADLDTRALKETGNFKALVTGDVVTGQHKYKNPFEFKPVARLVFSANEIPQSEDRSSAFHRRWTIIPFHRVFTQVTMDRDLRKKLLKPSELSGILNRALQGLRRLYQNDGFTEPRVVAEAGRQYKMRNNSFAQFVEDRVEQVSGESVVKQDFYQAYKSWCEEQGVEPLHMTKIKDALAETLPSVTDKRSGSRAPWRWVGIRLRE